MQQYQGYIQKQTKVNQALVELSQELGIPLVATNDIHYIDRSDWRAHEILMNIQSGEPCEIWEKDSMGIPNSACPILSARPILRMSTISNLRPKWQLYFHDLPKAFEKTVRSPKCDLEIDFKTKHYPVYVPPQLRTRNRIQRKSVKQWRTISGSFVRRGFESGILRSAF